MFKLLRVSKCKFWLTFTAVICRYLISLTYCIIVLAKQGRGGKDLAIGIANTSQDEWNNRQTGCQKSCTKKCPTIQDE